MKKIKIQFSPIMIMIKIFRQKKQTIVDTRLSKSTDLISSFEFSDNTGLITRPVRPQGIACTTAETSEDTVVDL